MYAIIKLEFMHSQCMYCGTISKIKGFEVSNDSKIACFLMKWLYQNTHTATHTLHNLFSLFHSEYMHKDLPKTDVLM